MMEPGDKALLLTLRHGMSLLLLAVTQIGHAVMMITILPSASFPQVFADISSYSGDLPLRRLGLGTPTH
jgi:hypothetical protein